jgi:hypothetical protein
MEAPGYVRLASPTRGVWRQAGLADACPKRSKALVRSIPKSLRALAQNLTFIGANWHRLYFYSRPQVATLRRRTSLPA